MYRLWCEWDFGQDNYVFVSEVAAYNWLRQNLSFQQMAEADNASLESYIDENLIGVEFLEIIS